MLLKSLQLVALSFLATTCYLAQYPLTPAKVHQGTYILRNGDMQATAWAVDKHHLVTAGHACEFLDSEYTLIGDYRRFHATSVLWEKGGDGLYDLCVLETKATLDNPLIISDYMPGSKAKVAYVGYPGGEYVESAGLYLGDLDGPEHWNDNVFTAPCAPGASGSAVYWSRGVWGVLVRLRTDEGHVHPGEEGCVAIGLDKLKAILDNAGVNYSVTPDDPTVHDPSIPESM